MKNLRFKVYNKAQAYKERINLVIKENSGNVDITDDIAQGIGRSMMGSWNLIHTITLHVGRDKKSEQFEPSGVI